MNSANHTPVPWSVDNMPDQRAMLDGIETETWVAVGSELGHLAYCHETNAEFIVRACNCHGELVAVLEQLEDIISGVEAQADNSGIDMREARAWWIMASDIMKKAKGES